jgi:hypothetical protein
MTRQEAIKTAIGNYLSYLLYGDSEYLNTAEHWLYYAKWGTKWAGLS